MCFDKDEIKENVGTEEIGLVTPIPGQYQLPGGIVI